MAVIRVPDKITAGDFTDMPVPTFSEDFKAPIWDDALGAMRWVTRAEWDTLLASTANRTLFDSLVAWWKFSESIGSRVDSVTLHSASDVGGVTRVSGPSNITYGIQTSKTTPSYLSVAHNADLLPGDGSFTFSFWIKPLGSDIYGFVEKGTLLWGDLINGSMRFSVGSGLLIHSYAFVTNAWHHVVCGYDVSAGKVFVRVNNGIEENTSTALTYAQKNDTSSLLIGRYSAPNRNINAQFAGFGMWRKKLSDTEVATLYASGSGLDYPFGTSTPATIDIVAPRQYQVAQSSGASGTIPLVYAVRHAVANVTATFNGGAGAQTSTTQGVQSVNLTGQNNGQGTLQLATTKRSASQTYIGLGDIFVVAGQSNASGRLTNSQSYSHATLRAANFGNNYSWQNLADPSDSASGQVDTVSSDSSPAAAGSMWPLVATSYMAARSAPCAFVPCAKGGTTSTQWLPGVNHQDRTTLYGSMVYRALQTGAKCILWWQGEQDAFNGVSTATYQANLAAIISALATDLPGVKFMPAKLHLGNTYSDGNASNIQTAIANIWAAGYSNVVAGPDFSAMRSESGDHFSSNGAASTVAGMWWSALQTAFGW